MTISMPRPACRARTAATGTADVAGWEGSTGTTISQAPAGTGGGAGTSSETSGWWSTRRWSSSSPRWAKRSSHRGHWCTVSIGMARSSAGKHGARQCRSSSSALARVLWPPWGHRSAAVGDRPELERVGSAPRWSLVAGDGERCDRDRPRAMGAAGEDLDRPPEEPGREAVVEQRDVGAPYVGVGGPGEAGAGGVERAVDSRGGARRERGSAPRSREGRDRCRRHR